MDRWEERWIDGWVGVWVDEWMYICISIKMDEGIKDRVGG